mgnify:CR=1 FL=1
MTMEITFVKMHGNGNDFILIDEYEKTVIPDEMKPQFAQLYCDRRFGIGADGVLYVSRSGSAETAARTARSTASSSVRPASMRRWPAAMGCPSA